MGRLKHLASGHEHLLSPRHALGRAPSCPLRIDDPGISGFHAEIAWDGQRWSVQDLGSRNGTALGERTLAKGEQVPLPQGAQVTLAGRIHFTLVDDSPPHLFATAADGRVRVAEDELLCLPADDDPELTIYRDLDGRWVVETPDDTTVLEHDVTVVARGQAWRVLSPRCLAQTQEAGGAERTLAEHRLCFAVSRDGEHVELALERDGQATSLEPRAHLMLLLLLARERLRDAEAQQLPPSECGWIYREPLAEDLGISPRLLHLWIHRARRQVADLGIRDAARIIERRTGTNQLRIGASAITIDDR